MSDLESRLAKLSPAQRALLEKRMRQADKPAAGAAPGTGVAESRPPAAEPIAVVGMACRLPGAPTLDDYWRVIRTGACAITETPADRWDNDALHDPRGGPGRVTTRWGGFLQDIDRFDPAFFGVTPREANRMDPQQRLLLEVAWEALEHAGRPADGLAGSRTGVYVGIGSNDYAKAPLYGGVDYFASIDGYMGTGNALSIAANRLSYLFDLRGPSLAVDTACSSSSVAIYLAVEALRRGECDGALAAGVNAILTPETTIAFSNAQMLSPRGRCRPFDAGADGYARGEGCGVVYLRRLADAQRAGEPVLAVLRAAAINQDGRTSGISAPNGESQKACLRAALDQAGLTPDEISYVEAHGTGTPLGDPIEMHALAGVFPRQAAADPPVRVTSVKANIGHTETVSGIAGLIKVALMMRHGQVPPQANLEQLNPHIELTGSRIEVPREATAWRGRRLAGVSSFGFGGTNSHLIVEAPGDGPRADGPRADGPTNDGPTAPPRLLKLTGKSPTAVSQQAGRLLAWLEVSADADSTGADSPDADSPDTDSTDADWLDICFTANTGRSDLPHRAVLVAADAAELHSQLAALAGGEPSPATRTGAVSGLARRRTAMLFSGQGSQLPGMGRGLYLACPAFRQTIDRCARLFVDLAEEPLTELLWGERSAELLGQTVYAQPALFAVELALAHQWRAWGVEPDMVAGHSIGEYVAAVVAGVVSEEDGLRLVAERGRLMQQAPPGGKMAAVFAAEGRVAQAIGDRVGVAIAAVNGPENTVVSGEPGAVAGVLAELSAAGVEHRPLEVSHAFHSPMMDDVLDDFQAFAATIACRKPRLPMASNLTGALLTDAPDARYWRDHLRGAVRFADNIRALTAAGASCWIEAGPGAALLGMVKRVAAADATHTAAANQNNAHQNDAKPNFAEPNDTEPNDAEPTLLPSLRRGVDDLTTAAGSLAQHYATGGRVDWHGWHTQTQGAGPRRRLLLPTYPFERTRCWIEGVDASAPRTLPASGIAASGSRATLRGGAPLLGDRRPAAIAATVYESRVSPASPAFLADHVVQGSVVAPAAYFVEQALEAAHAAFGDGASDNRASGGRASGAQPHRVEALRVADALVLSDDTARRVQVVVSPEAGGRCEAAISSQADGGGEWTEHATAVLVRGSAPDREGGEEATRPSDLSRVVAKGKASTHDAGVAEALSGEDFYTRMAERGFAYGPSFRVIAAVRAAAGVAEAQLDPAALTRHAERGDADLPCVHLHPAAGDACLQTFAAALAAAAGSDAGDVYLPVGIGSVELFHASAAGSGQDPAPTRCVAEVTSELPPPGAAA
ncbi:MAG: beta-ketoacyl synthase N-terminal-like domain-containing protein, partial [Planctomycetota bacterium]